MEDKNPGGLRKSESRMIEREPMQIGSIYQMKCGKVIDLKNIVAITEIHYISLPGYGSGVQGFEVYLMMTENPIIIHNHSWGGPEKVEPDRKEILDKWLEYTTGQFGVYRFSE